MALMKCPDCKAEISTEAPACPKCGRPNAARQAPPVVYSAPPEKRHVTISGCGTLIIIAAIVGVIMYFSNSPDNPSGRGDDSGNTSQAIAAPVESRPVQTYTAEQLYAMFHANEIKATQTIGDAIVRFTGTIASIEQSDFSKTPELMIRANCFDPGDCEDPDSWNTFEADLKASEVSSAAQLKIGQAITLQCGEVSMPVDVAAENCIIVKDDTGAAARQ